MKVIILAVLISFSSFASTKKICRVDYIPYEENKPSQIVYEFTKVLGYYDYKVTLDAGKYVILIEEGPAKVRKKKVRAGLSVNSNYKKLNTAEKLVVIAMRVEAHKPYEGRYKAGFPLKDVRSAIVYTYPKFEPGQKGSFVFEGIDETGKVLGSFLGSGDPMYPCK